eukprot:326563-Ditylum_brightwellii.AAC.1
MDAIDNFDALSVENSDNGRDEYNGMLKIVIVNLHYAGHPKLENPNGVGYDFIQTPKYCIGKMKWKKLKILLDIGASGSLITKE